MSIQFLAGGAAVMGIAVIMGCHDVLRVLRMKRALVSYSRTAE